MNIILEPSGGPNIVLWPQAEEAPYGVSNTEPAATEVWISRSDEAPTQAILFAVYKPGDVVRIPRSRVVGKSIRVYLRAVGPDGAYDRTYLHEAYSFDVSWTRKPPILDSIDSERPTVGAAPVIRRLDIGEAKQWVIYPFAPQAAGFSWDAIQIRIRKADEPLVEVMNHKYAPLSRLVWLAAAFDCVVDYRVRNKQVDDDDGWSEWSATSTAYGLASETSAVNEPDSEYTEHNFDPDEQTNYKNRTSLYDLP